MRVISAYPAILHLYGEMSVSIGAGLCRGNSIVGNRFAVTFVTITNPRCGATATRFRKLALGRNGRRSLSNAMSNSFDPEELYKPILKPVHTVSRAGKGAKRRGGRSG